MFWLLRTISSSYCSILLVLLFTVICCFFKLFSHLPIILVIAQCHVLIAAIVLQSSYYYFHCFYCYNVLIVFLFNYSFQLHIASVFPSFSKAFQFFYCFHHSEFISFYYSFYLTRINSYCYKVLILQSVYCFLMLLLVSVLLFLIVLIILFTVIIVLSQGSATYGPAPA